MKKKIIIILSVILVVLIGIILLILLQNNNTAKKDISIETYITNFENATYHTELAYYAIIEKDATHSVIEYNYHNDIEEYFYKDDNNKKINTHYNDYQNKKNYIKDGNGFVSTNLEVKSHKELLIDLLKNSKVKRKDGNAYTLEEQENSIKNFLTEFHKHDKNSLSYTPGADYEIIVVTKSNNISSIIITKKKTEEDVIYTFDNINQVETITLPKAKEK